MKREETDVGCRIRNEDKKMNKLCCIVFFQTFIRFWFWWTL